MDVKTWMRAQWDRVLGAVAVGAGLLALLLGYVGVAATPFPAEQLPFVVSGGVLGIVLVGIGLTSWLSADLRDEWRKLDRIERLLEQATDRDQVTLRAASPLPSPRATTSAEEVVATNGVPRAARRRTAGRAS